ncbi:MAG: type I methionyl aminopeptidase [Bacteroidetes bacterium]|nr:type I methionyl aminopeptidase [Bacteroidota bacterium]
MIYYKTKEEIELIRLSSLLVAKTHAELAKLIQPGITSKKLDTIAEQFIRDNGGVPAFKGYRGFPATLCVSPEDEVVHGIPNNVEIKEGTVLSIDCGVVMNGFYGDSAYTFGVGEISNEKKKLLRVTKESLLKGIENAVEGKRLGDISFAVQLCAERNGYGVVRELVGHGVGKRLHEEPEVANYGKQGTGLLLKEGLVLAVEPMINMGRKDVKHLNDGWTIKTKDGLPSAHFEHTVAVGKEKVDILSSFEFIEIELRKQNIEVI